MSIKSLRLAFNYAVADGQNESGPIKTLTITPAQEGGERIFPKDFELKIDYIASMSTEYALALVASSLKEYAARLTDRVSFDNEVTFVDPAGNSKNVVAATFIPH